MLLHREKTPATAFGAKTSTKFKVAANAKSFHIMIDAIYSNKISAPIRELWSNAYDSHLAVGTPDRPFYTKLPSTFDPDFVVRDYGTSMTPEIIDSVYSTMFESTKDTSNTEVGMFGLGSKSPWAYTDVFTVETFLDGTHRLYSAYIADDGCPAIDLMAVEETKEENGVRVSFPVEPSDIPTFRATALRIARGFKVLPETDDNTFFDDLEKVKPILEGEGWEIHAPKNSYGGGEAHVRQGCVIYPIDMHIIAPHTHDLSRVARAAAQLDTMIEMPIGTVSVAPDREKLSYDDATIQNIRNKLEEIGSEIKGAIVERFSNIKTLSEAVQLRTEISQRGNATIMNSVFHDIKWRGKEIPDSIYIPYTRAMQRLSATSVMMLTTQEMKYGRTYRADTWNGRFKVDTRRFRPKEARFYFEQVGGDVERVTHAGFRIKKEMEDFRAKELADDDDAEVAHLAIWVKYATKKDLARWLVAFGRPSADRIVNVNELPELPKSAKPVAKSARTKVNCHELNIDYNRWDEVEAEFEDGDDKVVYIATSRNEFVDFKGRLQPRQICGWVTLMKEKGALADDCRVVMIPATHKKILAKNKDVWTNFFPAARKFVEEHYSAKGAACRAQSRACSLRSQEDTMKVLKLVHTLQRERMLPYRGSDLRRIMVMLKWLDRACVRNADNDVLDDMNRELRPTFDVHAVIAKEPQVIDQDKLLRLGTSVTMKYPLINAAVSTYGADPNPTLASHLLEYMAAMDNLDTV